MKIVGLMASIVFVATFAGCKWCSCSQCPCCKNHDHEKVLGVKEAPKTVDAVLNIKTVQDFDEKVLKATNLVIVDFSAAWCGACQMVKPTFHKLAHEFVNKCSFATVDVDALGELAQRYGIQGIPTFILFKGGKQLGQPLVGALSEEKIRSTVNEYVGK